LVKRPGPAQTLGPLAGQFQKFTRFWLTTSWAIMRGMRDAQAKFAVLTGLFGVFAGAIGLMVDLPTLARM
jgi:hypothetical protein